MRFFLPVFLNIVYSDVQKPEKGTHCLNCLGLSFFFFRSGHSGKGERLSVMNRGTKLAPLLLF